MRRIPQVLACLIAVNLAPLFGRGPTLMGSGSGNPPQIRVAPGQITTFFVSGLKTDPAKPQKATGLPLPTSLAGISVTISQSSSKQSYSAPILAVQQLGVCAVGGGGAGPILPPDRLVGAITLQIPYELFPAPNPNSATFADVIVSQNGTVSKTFTVIVATDNLHVLPEDDPTLVPHLYQSPFTIY